MDQNNVKFKYIFDPAYNPKYANGAFGNITPHGEVALNFYFERSALPYEQEFALAAQNNYSLHLIAPQRS